METQELHPCLQTVRRTMEGLSNIMGSRYELILHDLSHVENSVVAVFGNVTQRQLGAPATNLLLQLLRKYGDQAPDCINYRNVLPDGRILRSSTIFIRDEQNRIVGSLCVNQELTDFSLVSKLLNDYMSFQPLSIEEPQTDELFAHDIREVMESMVLSAVDNVNKPIAYMQKDDKLAVVKMLEAKGIFDVKGAVEYVAERLGITNFTVYNYLKEIRCSKR